MAASISAEGGTEKRAAAQVNESAQYFRLYLGAAARYAGKSWPVNLVTRKGRGRMSNRIFSHAFVLHYKDSHVGI
ncbi:hypothetical protein DX884_01065 [Vibrio fluvialis]|nr:hypothetical protein [Vibrio fluvialis]